MGNQIMLLFLSIFLQIFCLSMSVTSDVTKILTGLSLEMIHLDSPKSPLYNANMTTNERVKKYIAMSTARVKSLGRTYHPKNKSLTLNPNEIIRPRLYTQMPFYLVRVGIGTFPDEHPTTRKYYLHFDPGSNFIWTQCEGCEPNCFHQVDPYFPASRSLTYKTVSSERCPPGATVNGNVCQMTVEYEDNAIVKAIVASEVFTFGSEAGGSESLNGLIFGCGINMQNFIEGDTPNNKISGNMGMGFGHYGFMRQTRSMFNGKFSYCLQSLYRHQGSPMYLRFGNNVLPYRTMGMQSTPLYRHKPHAMYYLNLQGISVGNQRLNITSNAFAIKSDGKGGCIIDSGNSFSAIVKGAFEVFETAVRDFMREENKNILRQMRNPELDFKLCFHYRYKRSQYINLPKITFHFEGADFEIGNEESFYFGTSSDGMDMVCMAYFDSDQNTCLGAMQQVNKRIVYDINALSLKFAPTDCSQLN